MIHLKHWESLSAFIKRGVKIKTSTIIRTATSTLLLLSLSVAHADEWTGNVSGFLGHKSVDSEDWKGLDSQGSLGVISDFGKQNWPVSIAIDAFIAGAGDKSDGQEKVAGTFEIHLGVRKVFTIEDSIFSPYVGGGVAQVAGVVENKNNGKTVDDDDTGYGYWAGVGTYIKITPSFNIGVDVRYSSAEVTLFDIDRDTDGLQAGITAGYHW